LKEKRKKELNLKCLITFKKYCQLFKREKKSLQLSHNFNNNNLFEGIERILPSSYLASNSNLDELFPFPRRFPHHSSPSLQQPAASSGKLHRVCGGGIVLGASCTPACTKKTC